MRMMLKFTIPVAKGNEAVKHGTIDRVLDEVIEKLKPEAVYFFLEGGKRAGIIIFEAVDSSVLPQVNEPLFAALDASIDIVPLVEREALETYLASMAT